MIGHRLAAALVAAVLLPVMAVMYPAPASATGGVCSVCTPAGVEIEAELATGATADLGTAQGAMTTEQVNAAIEQMMARNTIGSGATPAIIDGVGAPSATAASSGLTVTDVVNGISTGSNVVGLLVGGVKGWLLGASPDAQLPTGTVPNANLDFASWSEAPYSGPQPGIVGDPTNGMTGIASVPADASVDVYRVSRSAVDSSTHHWSANNALKAWENSATTGWSLTYQGHGYAGQTFPQTDEFYYSAKIYSSSGLEFVTYRPPDVQAQPQRWVEQTITCTKSDGTTVTSTATGTPQDFAAGLAIQVAALACPSGTRLKDWQADLKTQGGPDVHVGGGTAPDTSSIIPEPCLTSTDCGLRLQYNAATQGTPSWKDCPDAVQSICTDWETQVDRSRYRCVFGNVTAIAVVALKNCTILTPKYRVNPEPPQPAPHDLPNPPGSCSIGWGDLLTGLVVVKAVGCALVWAFVPDATSVETSTSSMRAAFDSSVFGQTQTAVSNFVGPFLTVPDGAGSCQGPAVGLTWINARFTNDFHPLDVCTGLPKRIHDWAEPLILVAMWGAALMSVWFFIAQSFGLNQ